MQLATISLFPSAYSHDASPSPPSACSLIITHAHVQTLQLISIMQVQYADLLTIYNTSLS